MKCLKFGVVKDVYGCHHGIAYRINNIRDLCVANLSIFSHDE